MYNFLIPSPIIQDAECESFLVQYRRTSGVPETAYTEQETDSNNVQLDLYKNVNYEIRVGHSCCGGEESNQITTNFIARNNPSLAFVSFNKVNSTTANIVVKIGTDVGFMNTYTLQFQNSKDVSITLPNNNFTPTAQNVYDALKAQATTVNGTGTVLDTFNSSDNTFNIKVKINDGLLNCTAIS